MPRRRYLAPDFTLPGDVLLGDSALRERGPAPPLDFMQWLTQSTHNAYRDRQGRPPIQPGMPSDYYPELPLDDAGPPLIDHASREEAAMLKLLEAIKEMEEVSQDPTPQPPPPPSFEDAAQGGNWARVNAQAFTNAPDPEKNFQDRIMDFLLGRNQKVKY